MDAFDVDITRSTVSKLLKRIIVTRKKLRVKAAQRNKDLRLEWQYCLQDFTADQLLFLDESRSDNRTGDRSYS